MTIKEQQKKRLNNYSKDELIEALLLSNAATVFVLTKCKALHGVTGSDQVKKGQKVRNNEKNN